MHRRLFAGLVATVVAVSAAPSAAAQNNQPICAGTRLPLKIGTGRSAPYVDVALEGKTGPFLIDYHAGGTRIEHGIWGFADNHPGWAKPPAAPHSAIALKGFGFPGWLASTEINFNEADLNNDVPGVGLQHGTIGVDLLVRQDLVFSYGGTQPEVIVSAYNGSCDSSALARAGFKLINQAGHWDGLVQNPANGVYDGPVAFIEFATTAAPTTRLGYATWAQIDTGYEDNVRPFSIDINQALFDKLQALRPALKEESSLPVTGCDGVQRSRRVFSAPGHLLRVENEKGDALLRVPSFFLILKNSDEKCGGISATSAPAAQLGASFLRAFGTTAFLGPKKEVWVKPAMQQLGPANRRPRS
jgi:hypothetical protein